MDLREKELANAPYNPVGGWLSLLRSAAFGAGFAIALFLILGSYLWYYWRKHVAEPWNAHAIRASLAERRITVLLFPPLYGRRGGTWWAWYTLENTTDYDYELTEKSDWTFMGIVDGRLNEHPKDKIDPKSFFIPPHERISFSVGHGLVVDSKPGGTDEEQGAEFRENTCANLRKGKFQGWVLFDKTTHYRIDFPPPC